jgi:hypothetical protein
MTSIAAKKFIQKHADIIHVYTDLKQQLQTQCSIVYRDLLGVLRCDKDLEFSTVDTICSQFVKGDNGFTNSVNKCVQQDVIGKNNIPLVTKLNSCAALNNRMTNARNKVLAYAKDTDERLVSQIKTYLSTV